jgi:hypothetical protein
VTGHLPHYSQTLGLSLYFDDLALDESNAVVQLVAHDLSSAEAQVSVPVKRPANLVWSDAVEP